jgi:uncharacterized Tic20 family protein
MSDHVDTTTSVHVYKPKFWVFLINLLSLIFVAIFIGLPLSLICYLAVSFFQQDGTDFKIMGVGFLCFLGPLIIMMGILLLQHMVNLVSGSFFSYIKVSATRLEQRMWPYKHIRCNWPDVDRIGKLWWFTDVVYLKSCEIIGPSISLRKPFSLFRLSSQHFISLSGYQGWPKGQLAAELRQFAPRLFEGDSVGQETVLSEPSDSSGLSQEERLLAALSHASILFSFIGIIVPTAIWASQKGKSTYLRFQALQAMIWQTTRLVFGFVTTACVMCTVLAPVFIIPWAENEVPVDVAFGGMFVLLMGVTCVANLVSFGFIVYGILGAILTYQGKAFRYAIIANILERRGSGVTINRG